MKTITKDILTVDRGIIGHQVNCQGVMGAGLALKIAKRWPMAKVDYLLAIELAKKAQRPLMGTCVIAEADPDGNVLIAHLFAQNYYGRNKQHTDYDALATALHRLQHAGKARNLPVYLPYGLGCGLAGGDWTVVERLIKENCWDAIICKLS